jgi:hypothetical protein
VKAGSLVSDIAATVVKLALRSLDLNIVVVEKMLAQFGGGTNGVVSARSDVPVAIEPLVELVAEV